ncbi:deoxynucleotide monophosphate kinase family protein [Fodinicola feengrottensis]|uniref:AAA family ATPase n=1 Tax=Fodinicola feengrottensis TaxID=435914 RepID=A0ABP4UF12_9ACTN|nr:hypothetical protein [Fodinicola feengrottensis]
MLPNIALLGRSRSGKDTVADFLVQEFGYQRFQLNEPVRELAKLLNPMVGVIDGLEARYCDALDAFGYESAKDEVPEVRHFLNAVGDSLRGVFGADVWAQHAAARLDAMSGGPVIVTDCRFLPEASTLDARGFAFWRMYRDAERKDNPADCEADALTERFSAVPTYNNGTPIDLITGIRSRLVALPVEAL